MTASPVDNSLIDNNNSNNQIPPSLPLNRISYQIAHHNHHSVKTKWFEIIIQIFGRYEAVENEWMSLSHCEFFNEDFYRLHKLKLNNLDPAKLLNPFKWLEFLIVAPLEMLSFGLFYLPKWFLNTGHRIPFVIVCPTLLISCLLGLASFCVRNCRVKDEWWVCSL